MARKILVTAAELDALRFIAERSGIYDETADGRKVTRVLARLLAKAEKARAPQPEQAEAASVSALESVLLANAGKRVTKLARLTAREYVMLSRDIRERGVSEDQMRVLALWLRRQKWMRGTTTLIQVLRNWGAWYGRAAAEEQEGRRDKTSGGPVLLDDEEHEEPTAEE